VDDVVRAQQAERDSNIQAREAESLPRRRNCHMAYASWPIRLSADAGVAKSIMTDHDSTGARWLIRFC
jgi:hypothetical protein